MIPVFVFLYISLKSISADNRHKLIDIHTDNTLRIANTIDSKLIELALNRRQTLLFKMDKQTYDGYRYFDSEFIVLKKQEICQDLNNYVAFSGILSNIIIVFPQKMLLYLKMHGTKFMSISILFLK